MELWIRSQDREYLEKVEKIYIWKNSFEEYQIDGKSELGTYKTKKRALEVLDEIQRLMIASLVDKNLDGYGVVIYEMPKE